MLPNVASAAIAMQSFVAAAIQMQSGADKRANVKLALERIAKAAGDGAQLVALPEVFSWRGPHDQAAAAAETIPGPTSDAMAAAAARHGIHLVAGSILETFPTSAEKTESIDRSSVRPGGSTAQTRNLPYNTTVLFGPDGSLLARYRKIHLFDVDLPGRVTIQESALRQAGDEVVRVRTPLGQIGLAVCYDLRFPELFRRLADMDTEIVVMPSAFTRPTGLAHWEPLVRARAIENQCFLLAPNQYGAGGHGFDDHGNSLAVDPWGVVLGRGPDDEPAIVSARFDAAVLEKVRRELPSLSHRRLA